MRPKKKEYSFEGNVGEQENKMLWTYRTPLLLPPCLQYRTTSLFSCHTPARDMADQWNELKPIQWVQHEWPRMPVRMGGLIAALIKKSPMYMSIIIQEGHDRYWSFLAAALAGRGFRGQINRPAKNTIRATQMPKCPI
jgi:hypothetical protein